LESGVTAKELKNILKSYENSPGSMPLDMFLEKHKQNTFKITESVGQTETGAHLSTQTNLRAVGNTYAFTKPLPNGNISLILVSVEK